MRINCPISGITAQKQLEKELDGLFLVRLRDDNCLVHISESQRVQVEGKDAMDIAIEADYNELLQIEENF